jgi:hypothetical protein
MYWNRSPGITMKIALVRKYYTDFGSAERYTGALAEHLLKSSPSNINALIIF